MQHRRPGPVAPLVLALISLLPSAPARAETVLKRDGSPQTLLLATGEPAATLLVESRGVSTETFAVSVTAPAGAVVKVTAASAAGRTPAARIPARSWWSVPLVPAAGSRPARSLTVTPPKAALRSASAPAGAACGGLTPEAIDAIAEQLRKTVGGTWDRARVCESVTAVPPGEGGDFGPASGEEEGFPLGDILPGVVPGGDVPFSPGGAADDAAALSPGAPVYTTEASGVLRKDACDRTRRRYFLKVTVDASGVDRAAFPAGVPVRARAVVVKHAGRAVASVKPVSDGKLAPRPLVLMSGLGGYSAGESVSVVKWRGGKPGRPVTSPVHDYVSYRGHFLSRTDATPLLRGGGKATFEAATRTRAFGVCMTPSRSRQRVGGYPGGD